MSGGTWDYQDRQLGLLADDIAAGHSPRWDLEGENSLGLPAARDLTADLLNTLARLIRDLDLHFADDGAIQDEAAWIADAKRQITRCLDRHPA